MVGKKEISEALETTTTDINWLYDNYLHIDIIDNQQLTDSFGELLLIIKSRINTIKHRIDYEINRNNTHAKISREVEKNWNRKIKLVKELKLNYLKI